MPNRTWFIAGPSRAFGALVVGRALAAGAGVMATAQGLKTMPRPLAPCEDSHRQPLISSEAIPKSWPTRYQVVVRRGLG